MQWVTKLNYIIIKVYSHNTPRCWRWKETIGLAFVVFILSSLFVFENKMHLIFILLCLMGKHCQLKKIVKVLLMLIFFTKFYQISLHLCRHLCYTNYFHKTMIMELCYEREQHIRKPLAVCATRLAGGMLSKMIKHLEVMLNIFDSFYVKKL